MLMELLADLISKMRGAQRGLPRKTSEQLSINSYQLSVNSYQKQRTINAKGIPLGQRTMIDEKNVLQNKSFSFAKRIIELYKLLSETKKEYVLSKQILKSGTSIGANITEANGAISKQDFSAKMSIAYKESLETKYWLRLLHETNYIEKKYLKIYLTIATNFQKYYLQF